MQLSTAVMIVKNLENKKFSDDDRVEAITQVVDMPSHHSVTKDELLKAMRYLIDIFYEG
ncbi:hypothetical protein [Anaerotignum propionicum]|uniref:Uncharacterized protein n=1 Tax=Anaerotignum propionicum DSM 1682 TaxID=991789 RepID=A0A0X1U6X3_ANAPI|nr:hypothetical protein [Anaerotignum propionicum]AMJ40683.1 hypothetical protein CPRO_10880 [Anaerotignum propionicum DSM 1682]SHE90194.1 hypothetical protein SAMN02745151_02141 [[Clostridium] propionicum DSM 1682] [Anaerotignum propionicum DSM 1682]